MIARCGPTSSSLGRRGLGYRSGVRTTRTIAITSIALLVAAVTAAGQGMYDPAPDPAPAPVPTPQPTKPTKPTAPWSPVAPPNAKVSWAGRLLVVATARANPGPGGKPLRLLQPIAPLGAGPVWLQVRGVKVVAGKRWVQVLMPVRPNGSTGGVRAADRVVRPIPMRIAIDVSARTLRVVRGGKVVQRYRVAVGTDENPTPTGRFAVAEVIPTGDPKAFLGPMVLPLTAFSDTLNEFAGGNGRVAIHGTSKPELIGQAVSHGCIRMRNADVLRLTRLVRGGTPVNIRA
jgi:lipoprotein-anchoring transpeptidase ErfK/SrfK